jgi:hypothetical protein
MKGTEVGAWGENYASGELELRGWIVAVPRRDEGIDFVAFKIESEQFKYAFIQVKTATWTKKSGYTITIRKSKAYEDPHFVFILVLRGSKDKVRFLVLTTEEWKNVMGESLTTSSWIDKGSYTFHIGTNLGKWKEYLNAFNKLEEL